MSMSEDQKKEKKIVRALKKLEKDWPEGYMLFSRGGNLGLYKGTPCDGGHEIECFNGIPSDGGDP